MQHKASGGAGEPAGDGEQPQSQAFGFPPSGRVVVQGEHLEPGGELAGKADDGAPDLVLGGVVQGEVGQAGVFGVADAVFAAGPPAMAQLEVGELPSGGVGGERRDA